jgi:hypothetical protein
MDKVKIYGERNTGTNFLTRLIRRNFFCEVVPGTLAEAKPGYRDAIEEELAKNIADECKRMFARQSKLDSFFQGNLWDTLGWKHAVPPISAVQTHPERENILFITVTKNPYAWLLSLFKRPYDDVSLHQPDSLLDFINQPWFTGRRENTPALLDSPVELWNLKIAGYDQLKRVATVKSIRYEDVLADPFQLLQQVENHFERRSKKYELPVDAVKKQDTGKKDFEYYRDYYLNERWQDKLGSAEISAINRFLAPALVENAGYTMLSVGE